MTVRKHVPPHFLTPGTKRRVALAVVFGAEVVLGLIAVSALLPARSAAGAASPQAGYTAARTVQPTNYSASPIAQKRNAAIAKLAACETDSECDAAEAALRAAGCSLQQSGVTLCPVDRGAVETQSLPLISASSEAAATPQVPTLAASLPAQPAPQVAFYTTEHGKEDCLADAEALPGGQVCIADYEGVR